MMQDERCNFMRYDMNKLWARTISYYDIVKNGDIYHDTSIAAGRRGRALRNGPLDTARFITLFDTRFRILSWLRQTIGTAGRTPAHAQQLVGPSFRARLRFNGRFHFTAKWCSRKINRWWIVEVSLWRQSSRRLYYWVTCKENGRNAYTLREKGAHDLPHAYELKLYIIWHGFRKYDWYFEVILVSRDVLILRQLRARKGLSFRA